QSYKRLHQQLPLKRGGPHPPVYDRSVFHGTRRQRAAGLGALFGAMAQHLMPFARKYIVSNSTKALTNSAPDLLTGERNFEESLKSNSMNALKGIGRDYLNQKGKGKRRKKISNKAVKSRSKRSRIHKDKHTEEKIKRSVNAKTRTIRKKALK
ncbi:unnamed protein product, partial [Allacma fusca]